MVSLNTERLVLREFVESDIDALHEIASDPEVYRYMSWGNFSEGETRDFLRRVIGWQSKAPRVDYELAVGHPEAGLIGGVGIYMRREGVASIGYYLKPSMWGKGYGTEVIGSVIHFGFHQLGLHRVEAGCDTRNVASYRVMEKNGMLREGILRENKRIHGEWRTSYIYSILENEYWE